MFGKATKEEILSLNKMNYREISIFVPIVILVLFLGVYAVPLLDITKLSISDIYEITEFHNNQSIISQIAQVKMF